MNNLFCDLKLRSPISYDINVYNPKNTKNKMKLWVLNR